MVFRVVDRHRHLPPLVGGVLSPGSTPGRLSMLRAWGRVHMRAGICMGRGGRNRCVRLYVMMSMAASVPARAARAAAEACKLPILVGAPGATVQAYALCLHG